MWHPDEQDTEQTLFPEPHALHDCTQANLPGSEGDRCPSLNEQFSHLKVATVEGIMKWGNAFTPLAARVIHCSPMVQKEADDFCEPGEISLAPSNLFRSPDPQAHHVCPV